VLHRSAQNNDGHENVEHHDYERDFHTHTKSTLKLSGTARYHCTAVITAVNQTDHALTVVTHAHCDLRVVHRGLTPKLSGAAPHHRVRRIR
jgi:hypothetical protein